MNYFYCNEIQFRAFNSKINKYRSRLSKPVKKTKKEESFDILKSGDIQE